MKIQELCLNIKFYPFRNFWTLPVKTHLFLSEELLLSWDSLCLPWTVLNCFTHSVYSRSKQKMCDICAGNWAIGSHLQTIPLPIDFWPWPGDSFNSPHLSSTSCKPVFICCENPGLEGKKRDGGTCFFLLPYSFWLLTPWN